MHSLSLPPLRSFREMPFQNKVEKIKRYIGCPIKHADDIESNDRFDDSASAGSRTVLSRLGRKSLDATRLPRSQCRSRRRGSVASVLDLIRGISPGPSRVLHPDPEDVARSPPPQLVAAFANSLTRVKISNFLIWFFYFDVVELPDSPTRWFGYLPSMDLRGWVALGTYLKAHSSEDVMFLRLDDICQQLNIRVPQVFDCAIELADPRNMCWTRLATTIQVGRFQRKDEGQILDSVQKVLFDMRGLVSSLKPIPQTIFSQWQPIILHRVSDFLDVVIHPRLTLLREGMRILTDRSQEEQNEIHYFYEAMQLPRKVPLGRYGIFSDLSIDLTYYSSNSSTEQVEQFRREETAAADGVYSQADLDSENRALRARVIALEKTITQLRETNRRLARRVSCTPPATPTLDKCIIRKPVPSRRSVFNHPLPALPPSRATVSVLAHPQASARDSGEPLSDYTHRANQNPSSFEEHPASRQRSTVILDGQMEAREWMGSLWKNRELPNLPLTNPLTANKQSHTVSEWGRRRGYVARAGSEQTLSTVTSNLTPAPLFAFRNRLKRSGSGQNLGSVRNVGGVGRKRSLSTNALEILGRSKPDISTNF
jgi:hypothetical protein